jgi:thiopeptide-type bacteriocin biosynthesis protein
MASAQRRLTLRASGFFVLRTPLFPFDEFESWGAAVEAPTAGGDAEALADALERDRKNLRDRLAQLTTRPDFRDALFVASPKLEAVLDRWQREPDSERARKSEPSIVAYFSRAAARPTPFGLFAGCSTGTVAASTTLRLESHEHYRRHTTLDMEYLCALAEAIQRDPALRCELVYRPNSSLYEAGGRLNVVEASQTPGRRAYKLVAIDKTPYLEETLARAAGGATFDALAAALVDDEVTRADAEEYVSELVASQLLLGDVEPQLTGTEPLVALVETLAARTSTAPLAERLDEAAKQGAAIDAEGIGVPRHRYEAIASTLAALPAEPQIERLVQVDLMKPARELTLGVNVVDEVAKAVAVLRSFAPAPERDALARFRDKFVERYETREVPLVEALDEEHGIGFELLDPGASRESPRQGAASSPRHRLLLRKYAGALATGAGEITVEADELTALDTHDRRPLPEGVEVLATLEAASAGAVDAGDFRVLIYSVSGPPGARLTARFCHVDPLLNEYVAAQVRAEEGTNHDCVFAEIVHLPEDRVGNILGRPVLREYEIPYLGASAAPPERQLPVTDLLVSIDGERVVLRSRRLDKEVNPRLTTAHNFAFNSLPVYRFLAALQHQGVTPALLWDWGPLAQAPFLPRVVTGRAVLARARWNLDESDIAILAQPSTPEGFAAVHALKRRRTLPRFVALADADNELVVDFHNVLSLEALARELKNRSSASLVELLPDPDNLLVDGPDGRFTHQFILPFLNDVPASAPPSNAGARRPTTCTRRFVPGSEWIYVKFFGGSASTDLVLDRVARAVEAALASKAADRWFFIRYSDPDWHLRVRVHGVAQRLAAETLPMLQAVSEPLIAAGKIWRVQLDTYEREVERYGGDDGIALAEQLFHADSKAVVALVRALGGSDSDLRRRVALAGMYFLLDDFELPLDRKRMVVRRACEGYGYEFGTTKDFQREMSRRYREERADIEALLYSDVHSELLAPLKARTSSIVPIARELRTLADAGQLTQPLPDLLLSFAHMHVNRLLRSAQRAHELVLYEMLSRIYSSEAGRTRAEVVAR